MKNRVFFSLVICISVVSISNAQFSRTLRDLKNNSSPVDFTLIHKKAINLLHSAAASSDTMFIPGGIANPGLMESMINGDTLTTSPGGRTNPMRVYVLQADSIYIQNAGLNVVNPAGVLTIVGASGGKKPVITPQTVNGVKCGMNTVQGSIKLRNIYMEGMLSDGSFNDNVFVGSTANNLPQFVDVDNCMFEFVSLEWFSCNGYTNGAKFRFTNCYFRNLFNQDTWFGGGVFECNQWIDTIWVENVTVTDGGKIFSQQNSLCKFAYYNHNTIINSNNAWQTGVYYLEGYWVNNFFINQNWVGQDYYNMATGILDPDPAMLTSTISIDTIDVENGTINRQHIHIQPEFMSADSTIDYSKVGLAEIKAFASNNILWTDTVILKAYYHNMTVDAYGPYGTRYVDTCPASWLMWTSATNPPFYLTPQSPPYQVVNIPSIWMNQRTQGLFDNPRFPMIEQSSNYINTQVRTVTPAIKDAATSDQMAKWNACQYGVPGFSSSTNDIVHSSYIFGDYDPVTIPGYKTEDGSGISKFTDLIENFAQTGTLKLSTIDGFPVGALIWDDAALTAYNSATEFNLVHAAYIGSIMNKGHCVCSVPPISGTPRLFALNQNYPDPFNPTTQISYSIPETGLVTLKIYNILGQEVATLFSGMKDAGNYEATFDGSKLASGVYFYRLQAGNQMQVKKMVMLK